MRDGGVGRRLTPRRKGLKLQDFPVHNLYTGKTQPVHRPCTGFASPLRS